MQESTAIRCLKANKKATVKLYRYFSNIAYAMDAIRTDQLYLSLSDSFNDPFDCKVVNSGEALDANYSGDIGTVLPMVSNILLSCPEFFVPFLSRYNYEEMEEQFIKNLNGKVRISPQDFISFVHQYSAWEQPLDDFKELLTKSFIKRQPVVSVTKRVACFSEVNDSILMWAYYANCHKLILKNKERLLSFDEPTRFIFSHSALREGWDNPNVFQICTLKHSDSNTAKRQEVGRGLRLCVNQSGNRMDVESCGETVHDINMLTVIASESYKSFVTDLQSDIKTFEKAFLAKKAIQDYVFTDGTAEKSIERKFAEDLDAAEEVCVYAKLPRTFQIPTPVGNYSPDWAIAFYEGKVKHIFFVAETKGTMESLNLRPIEQAKISCAKKLFNEMSTSKVKYHDVDSYQSLLNIMQGL